MLRIKSAFKCYCFNSVLLANSTNIKQEKNELCICAGNFIPLDFIYYYDKNIALNYMYIHVVYSNLELLHVELHLRAGFTH